MGAAAAPLSLASTGLSAFGSIMGGNQAAENAKEQGRMELFQSIYTSKQLETAAMLSDLKATETDTYMRRRTEGTLANIDAVLATTGTQDSSPTSWAVKNRFEYLADESRTNATWGLKMDAMSKRHAAQLYLLSGMMAMSRANENASALRMNGIMGGIGGLLKGVSGMNWN